MTTIENNFTDFEGVCVSKVRNDFCYKVELEEEDYTFLVKEKSVIEISSFTGDNPNVVAILLAYIEYARWCRNEEKYDKVKRIDEYVLIKAISVILYSYSVERMIEIIKDLKWYQIKDILESDNPILKLEEII